MSLPTPGPNEMDKSERTISADKENLEGIVSFLDDLRKLLPVPFFYTGPTGIILDINQSFENLFAYSIADIVGESATTLFQNPNDFEQFLSRLNASKDIENLETTLLSKEKKEILTQISGMVRRDLEGNITGYFFSAMDITDRKKAEEKFKVLFDNSPDIYYLIDFKGYFIDGNSAAEKAIGYKKEEIIGKNIATLGIMDPLDIPSAISHISQVSLGKKIDMHEYRMIRKNGERFTVEVQSAALNFGGKHVILGVARDVTKRKAAEKQLLIQRDLAMFLSQDEGNLDNILTKILDYALQVGEIDAGGIYLVNKSSGLDLIVHKGLSENFISQVDHLSVDSPQVQLANNLEPVYQNYQELKIGSASTLQEGIRGIAIIPIVFENKLVAVMNLASHTVDNLSQTTREQIEFLASQVGSIIAKQVYSREIQKEKSIAQKYLDIASVIILALDSTGKIVEINKKGCEVLGDTRANIIGKNWIETYIPQEERQKIAELHKQVLAQNSMYYDAENNIVTKNGQRLIAWHNSIVKSDLGEVVGTISSGEDITEKRAAETKQQEYTNQLERLNKLMVGRELKMKELKQRIKILESKKEDTI